MTIIKKVLTCCLLKHSTEECDCNPYMLLCSELETSLMSPFYSMGDGDDGDDGGRDDGAVSVELQHLTGPLFNPQIRVE